jgi:hypothetical protein
MRARGRAMSRGRGRARRRPRPRPPARQLVGEGRAWSWCGPCVIPPRFVCGPPYSRERDSVHSFELSGLFKTLKTLGRAPRGRAFHTASSPTKDCYTRRWPPADGPPRAAGGEVRERNKRVGVGAVLSPTRAVFFRIRESRPSHRAPPTHPPPQPHQGHPWGRTRRPRCLSPHGLAPLRQKPPPQPARPFSQALSVRFRRRPPPRPWPTWPRPRRPRPSRPWQRP